MQLFKTFWGKIVAAFLTLGPALAIILATNKTVQAHRLKKQAEKWRQRATDEGGSQLAGAAVRQKLANEKGKQLDKEAKDIIENARKDYDRAAKGKVAGETISQVVGGWNSSRIK